MLQRHRKSQSTSALSVIADGGVLPPLPPLVDRDKHREGEQQRRAKRLSQHPALGRVDEVVDGRMPALPGLTTPGKARTSRDIHAEGSRTRDSKEKERQYRARSRGGAVGEAEVRAWMGDIMSLRSSERRRLAALKGLERALMGCCTAARSSSEGGIALATFVGLQLHNPLVALLTGHARALSSRHPPQADELNSIVIELEYIVRLLQGLCLMSAKCKAACGEQHVLEIIIDLLLLLRTQPPQPSVDGEPTQHSIVYNMLELLCCILVDSPANSRSFEKLSGLEAVVRVLKGTGVAKEIRMKCLEFLYFYLLPENTTPPRAVSSSSSTSQSSSSSAESMLYPPSPLSSSTGSISSSGRISPSPMPSSAHIYPASRQPAHRFEDLDVPFVPQTPKKKPQPSLGYLTPSTRRVSGGTTPAAATPSLAPITASPVEIRVNGDDRSSQSVRSRLEETPRKDSRRWSVMESRSTRSSTGLGLGLPKSTSLSSNLAAAAGGDDGKRDVTAIKLDAAAERSITAASDFTDPFSDTRSSSSGSSTVVPPRMSSGMSRSSTTSDLVGSSSPSRTSSHNLGPRSLSVRRPSRLAQVSTPDSPEPSKPAVSAVAGQPQKIRHSRTQSHMSSLPPPPVPSTRLPASSSAADLAAMGRRRSTPPGPIPSSTPMSAARSTPVAGTPQPTPAKRAFPAELTRGNRMTPSASSPSLVHQGVLPLGAARRIPSGKRMSPEKVVKVVRSERAEQADLARGKKDPARMIKSVEEKKELLSSWIGNVDALVEGVEKVSFWGSITKKR